MRKLAVGLVALGVFLAVAAPMVRFYMYPKLAVAPADQNSTSVLVGPGATIFDTATLSEITTDLTTTNLTVGDVKAAEAEGNNVVVWQATTSSRSSDGVIRSRDIERYAFDATTGEAVNCCGEFVSEEEGVETPVEHKGLQVKFPFNTQKDSYDWWDGTLREAVEIKYVGTETVEGLSLYKFSHAIEATKVGEREVPAALIGESGDENVMADVVYSNVRTLWVEPNTGVVIKREEIQDNTLDYDGTPRITTTKVTTGFDDATVKANADKYGPLGKQLHLLHTVLPPVLLILGLLAAVGGFLLLRRDDRRQGSTDDSSEDETLTMSKV